MYRNTNAISLLFLEPSLKSYFTQYSSLVIILFKRIYVGLRFLLRSCWYEKNYPTRWDVLREWDIGKIVYCTLQKQIVYMRIDSSHPAEISRQRRWDLT